MTLNWIHDLPMRMEDMKTKRLSIKEGKALHAEWTVHFEDPANYEVDLDSNLVLLK